MYDSGNELQDVSFTNDNTKIQNTAGCNNVDIY